MVKALCLYVLIFSIAALAESHTANTPNNFNVYKAQIVCETVCYQDGDEIGLVIEKQCYCANRRDTSHIVTKVMSIPTQTKEDKRDQVIRW